MSRKLMPRRKDRLANLSLMATLCGAGTAAHADGCPDASQDIATDRPSVTNSASVVLAESLQMENGVNQFLAPS